MREILFRGKRIDNGEWVYGSFCMDALEQKNGLCGMDGFIRLYDHIEGKMQMYEVDRETVCQYTGLTDKNGKKIFEGDIIKVSWHAPRRETVYEQYEVVYSKSGFFAKRSGKLMGQISNYVSPNVNMRCEVIGNIHDNDLEDFNGN